MIQFDPITRDVFIGTALKHPLDVNRLRSMGLTCVLNLQTEKDIEQLDIDWLAMEKAYTQYEIQLLRVPMIDFDDASFEANVEDAARILSRQIAIGHRVYVHCTAGMERSPSTVIAYLCWHQGWDLDKAAEHVMQKRRCNPKVELIRRLTAERSSQDF